MELTSFTKQLRFIV